MNAALTLRLGSLVLLFVFATPAPGKADGPPPTAAEFREPDGSDDSVRTLTIAIYLLIALTVGVVSLMLVLMLWGARVRREARKPLPATKPNDPLWYLKSKNRPTGEPPGPSNVSDGGIHPETKTDQPPPG